MASPSESVYARGFATDAETERALRAGLAGHEASVQRGRLPVALQALATAPSSKLVFVDLDGIPEPETAAKELTAVCAFGTALIAIGSTDTAHLTRALLRQGIADYLVKPISAAAVREASATALDDLPERTYAGRVIAFAGTAGSGASTLIAAIARGVAAGGRTASVIDLNPASGTLADLLGAEPAGDLPTLLATLDAGHLDPDESRDPDEASDTDPTPQPRAARQRLCAVRHRRGLARRVSPRRPVAGTAAARGDAYAPGTSRQPGPCRAGDRSLRPGCASRDHAEGGRPRASLRADAAEHQRSGAVPGAARSGAPHHSRAEPSAHAQKHTVTGSDTLCAGRTAPDVIIPFEPALHAAATGEAQNRPPGKAYRQALRQVIERAVEGPAPVGS